MEDPKEDLLVVHCFCIYRGGALLGGGVGVIGSVEHEFLSVLSFPRFLYCICIKAAVIAFVIFRFCMFCLLVALI